MITPDYVRTMARYGRWQNRSLFSAADGLDEAARQAPRGAFFGSIHGTLNHLLWGDQIWMSRFAGTPPPTAAGIPDSPTQIAEWAALRAERAAFDEVIVTWAESLDPAWLDGELAWYSAAAGRQMREPRALLVAHMFNHQTHHRGQVHAMLTAAGARPDDTDLMLLPMREGA